ncbi:AAA family ATPase [Candidatus Woesearchaeota archaeon]|nr:AAA family ATPase [Candidatus Woesearchaeota archaeon]
MTKIKTNIPGFDKLVGGGLPLGKNILLSGTPGTGKTIFALQYLFNGADKFNEKGIYISFEEEKEDLIEQASQFGWDFEKLEKEKKLKIISIPVSDIKSSTAKEILNIANKYGAKRIVIDSLSALSINTPTTFHKTTELTEISIKRFMYSFINQIKNRETTCLLISQTIEGQMSRDTVSEFICDGVVLIHYESMGGDFSRSLTIRKMRECKNDTDIHPVEINNKGIRIHSLD